VRRHTAMLALGLGRVDGTSMSVIRESYLYCYLYCAAGGIVRRIGNDCKD
jgi:hypothetical protein